MRSVFPDRDDARELAASVDAAAAAVRRLADASLRIAVLVDPVPRILLLHDSGRVVRDMTYDELFDALASRGEQFGWWTARDSARLSATSIADGYDVIGGRDRARWRQALD